MFSYSLESEDTADGSQNIGISDLFLNLTSANAKI